MRTVYTTIYWIICDNYALVFFCGVYNKFVYALEKYYTNAKSFLKIS